MYRPYRALALALIVGSVLADSSVRAQSPTANAPSTVYVRNRTFSLPIALNDQDRITLQEVQLYVKKGAGDTWTCKEAVPPTSSEFAYRAQADGEYWFTMAAIEKAGKLTAPDLSRLTPQLVVIVDTQPPELSLQLLPASARGVFVECKVSDAHLDPSRVRVEYLAADKSWKALEAQTDAPSIYRVPEPIGPDAAVRATASDRAGNTTLRGLSLTQVAATARGREQPSGAPAVKENALQRAVAPADNPAQRAPNILDSQVQRTALPVQEHTAAAPARQLVNGTHVTLDYQIEQQGPSGVGRVDVWMTRDGGTSWQRLCDDPDRRSPVEFDLPGEGVYGISLAITNGNGFGAAPPAKGDVPDYSIEVDVTRPVAQLLGVRTGNGEEAGSLMITWKASDKNLGQTPVDLYFATQPGGPWATIARGVRNDGRYRWQMPREAGPEFYVRLEVTDQAGNRTRSETQQAVVVDWTRPKARVLGVTASTPRVTNAGGN